MSSHLFEAAGEGGVFRICISWRLFVFDLTLAY